MRFQYKYSMHLCFTSPKYVSMLSTEYTCVFAPASTYICCTVLYMYVSP